MGPTCHHFLTIVSTTSSNFSASSNMPDTFIDPYADFDPYESEPGYQEQESVAEDELVPPTPSSAEGNRFKWHNRQNSLSQRPGRGHSLQSSFRRTSSPLSGGNSRSQSPHTRSSLPSQGSSFPSSHSSTLPFPPTQQPRQRESSSSNSGHPRPLASPATFASRPSGSLQRGHSRRHSGSPSLPSTPQSSDTDYDSIYMFQDPYSDFRENQLQMMNNLFYLMRRVDTLYGEVSWLRQAVGIDPGQQGPGVPDMRYDSKFSIAHRVTDDCLSTDNGAMSLANFHLHQPDFANPLGFSAERPNDYPFDILWNFDDCKTEEEISVIFTSGNEGRPIMEKALRDEDGNFLSADAFNRIKASVRSVAAQLLQLPVKMGDAEARTKRYFKSAYLQEWTNALGMLEFTQPIVRLCSAHWKADHLIAQHLRSSARNNEDDERKHKRRRAMSSQAEQLSQGSSKPSSGKYS